MNKAYGWWQFAPEWKLVAGQDDTTAAVQAGWDWDTATSPAASGGMSDALNEFIRLVYASGPLSFAIAVEDANYDTGNYNLSSNLVRPDTTTVSRSLPVT